MLFANTVFSRQIPSTQKVTVFYIDALNGKDSNAGTSIKHPWKTLGKVNRQIFKAGDKVYFKSNTIYQGCLKLNSSGKKGSPIIVDQYGKGSKPKIQGNGIERAALELKNNEYWEIANLDISNQGLLSTASRTGILIELKDYGVAHHILLKNLDVHDVNGSLVKKEGGGAGITINNQGSSVKTCFDSLIVENCTVRRTERNGIIMNGNWSRNSWFPNKHVIIRKNLIEQVPGDGIVPIGCDSAVIEHNVMRNCTRLLPDGESAAGIWPWSCDNTIIQYNEVSDHKAPWDGQGFDADWNCRNTIIQYNYSHDNEGGFLLVCNDGGVKMLSSIGNTGTIVRYNISVNDGLRTTGKHAGFAPNIHITGPASNTKIYNNLIYIPRRTEAGYDSTLVEFGNWKGYADSTLLANNVFYTLNTADFKVEKASNVSFINNLYCGKYVNLPDDQSAVKSDPQFTSWPKINDGGFSALKVFRLQKNSPAKEKGSTTVTQPKTDFFGKIIKLKGVPNIGIEQ